MLANWVFHLEKAGPRTRSNPFCRPPNTFSTWLIALAFLASLFAPAHLCPPANASAKDNTEAAALEFALQTGAVICEHGGGAAPDGTHKGQNSCDGHCCCQIIHAFGLPPPPGMAVKTNAPPIAGARGPPAAASSRGTLAALAARPRGPPNT